MTGTNGNAKTSGPTEPITEELFRQAYQYEEIKEPTSYKKLKRKLSCTVSTVTNLLPILKWLPEYNIKTYLMGDVIAGLTVAVMHIPHGLAYAPLGGQEPVVGLYMAVFPTIIYMLMGTSKHISLGTFAVLCVMVGQTVSAHSVSDAYSEFNGTMGSKLNETKYSSAQVGVAVCLTVGLWQTLLGLLKLGSLSVLLSNSLVSGFTTGAAVHVITFQIKNLLGIKVQSFTGPLKLFYLYIDIFSNIQNTNLVTMGISLCSIFVLFTFNQFIKPIVQKNCTKCRVPIPIELLVIIAGILLSYFLELSTNHDVHIVANVPKGLPSPTVPPFQLLPKLIIDGFVIAVVGISISLSLAAIFAKKSRYHVSGNQELLAYGAANIFGAFFSCLPVAASLSRSLVQHAVGGKTLLSNLFSMTLIILILLFMGPLFEPVPYAVLSSIVFVSLKGLVMQVTDFPAIYKQSRLDGAVWLATFASVVVLDLDYGLGIGVLTSIATMLLRSQTPEVITLGRVPNTNVFLDLGHYKAAKKLPNIVILQIIGGLHFANSQQLENRIAKLCQYGESDSARKYSPNLILNMAAVSYIDPTAVNSLVTLYKDLKSEYCDMYLAECTSTVYRTLNHCNFFKQFPKEQALATLFDAVEFVNDQNKTPPEN